jgi:Homeodomain-like domain
MKRYKVTLTEDERQFLHDLIAAGKIAARKLSYARILLKADASPGGPAWTDQRIVEALEVDVTTVGRIRQRFVEEGLDAALNRKKQAHPSRQPKLDGRGEAYLIALACSSPPDGRTEWTFQLLADKLVELKIVDRISDETVRRVLKKHDQAVPEGAVVHSPASACRVRVRHRGSAGGLPPQTSASGFLDFTPDSPPSPAVLLEQVQPK